MSSTVPIKTEEVILENVEYQSTEELDEELQLQLEDSGGESSYIIQGDQTYEHHQGDISSPSSKQLSRQRHNSSGNNNSMSSQGGTKLACGTLPPPPSVNKSTLENEKRLRREIANSNERRRMQSINAGFQNLRSLLPRHEGEKLSKAAILQQTSQYICELENQKTQLLAQNSQLKRQLGQHEATGGGGGANSGNNNSTAATTGGSNLDNSTTNATENNSNIAIKKRKLTDNVANAQTISDSSDEGLGSMSPEPMTLLNAGGGGAAAVAAAAKAAAEAANTKAQILLAQNIKELTDLKDQLFKERRLRTMLEEELQMIKRQLYSVATAPQPTAAVEADETDGTATYIPRVIEHTGNILRSEDCEEFSYVEIDELTGQQQVVVCSSIEELDSETAAAEIITEDHVHEEVVLSSSSTESEQEVAVNAIAKVYAEGNTPTPAMLQPILQAAIKATPKVEVERISDAALKKVKTEKIEQTSGLTRSRQNLETIVEAIRHLEGDHLFTDSNGEQHKVVLQTQAVRGPAGQEVPLALTTKQHVVAQRKTLAELRPFLQLKGGSKILIGGPGGGTALTLTKTTVPSKLAAVTTANSSSSSNSTVLSQNITPTAIFKVQTTNAAGGTTTITHGTSSPASSGTAAISTTALKQCRPGVIVAKKLS
ncbi:transcription factor cropped [Musca autumnalis]|uniref:transcription factor cropped n=1 Tax=Musca autumnalis TaxID=221902 RepID=UPI003CE9307B